MAEHAGWIKLFRAIRQHRLWKEKPFAEGQAWIDLLIRANFHTSTVVNPRSSHVHQFEAGEVLCSIRSLALAWGWDRLTVRRWLVQQKKDGMIEAHLEGPEGLEGVEKHHRKHHHPTPKTPPPPPRNATASTATHVRLIILNWNKFQGSDTEMPPQTLPPPPVNATTPPPKGHRKSTPSKEDKKKNIRIEGSPPPASRPPAASPPGHEGPNPLERARSTSPRAARSILANSQNTGISLPDDVRQILESRAESQEPPVPSGSQHDETTKKAKA